MVSNCLPQPAQSLLNAGFGVGRTVGAVLDRCRWLGRQLGQPLPGLVADQAGLIALGAVEAIVPVWIWGVGHGDQSWVAVRADQASAGSPWGTACAGVGSHTLCLMPRRVDLRVT
jgi:hypothetical protein